MTCCFILSGRYIRICRNSRFFLRLFYAADRDRSFKFGELTTVNDAWCAETPVPGRAQRANVTFTLHSFPNFTTWLYVVKIDIGNSCVCVCVCTQRGPSIGAKKGFANGNFQRGKRISSLPPILENIYSRYYFRIKPMKYDSLARRSLFLPYFHPFLYYTPSLSWLLYFFYNRFYFSNLKFKTRSCTSRFQFLSIKTRKSFSLLNLYS